MLLNPPYLVSSFIMGLPRVTLPFDRLRVPSEVEGWSGLQVAALWLVSFGS